MSQPSGPRPTPIPGRSSTLIEPQSAPKSPIPNRSSTLIESEFVPSSATATAVASRPVELFRPNSRPTLAILTVFDDGLDDGETVRLRGDRFVIGRSDGDLLLPHDSRVSSKHLEITRHSVSGGYRWMITDLQSTNGLFVRVRRALLIDGSEFLVGSGRYRFTVPNAAQTDTNDRGQTLGWQGETTPVQSPSLIEMIGSEEGNRYVLMRPEYWIGTESPCSILRADDRFCEPKHARLYRAPTGDWTVEQIRTLNGIWLRMNQVEADGLIHFQIGEQRLRLTVQ